MAMGGKTLTVYLAADLKNFNRGLSDADRGLSGFGGTLKNTLGPAAIAAAAAVSALAVAMAVDGVKAAIEDEAAAAKLAQTLTNLGLAHDTGPIEEYISSLEMATGIADDTLRPAYDRLIRSVGDTAAANELLALSLDISAGTGKELKTVTEALGKAYDGNTTGLSRLGAGIDAAILRTGDMNLITQTLANTFGGQAKTQAETFQGQIDRVSLAADNLKEAFGKGFLTVFAQSSGATTDLVQDMKNLEGTMEATGAGIGSLTKDIGIFLLDFAKYTGFLTNFGATWENFIGSYQISFAKALGNMTDAEADAEYQKIQLKLAADLAGTSVENLGQTAENTIPYWNRLTYAVGMSTQAYAQYVQANALGRQTIQNANKDYQDLAARQSKVNTYQSIAVDLTTKLNTARSGGSSITNKFAKAQESLTDAFKQQNTVVSASSAALQEAISDLETARGAVEDYATSIQENLLSGVNLGKAYTNQFNEAGERTGMGVVQGFTDMVNQADWFGNVLLALKAQGVDQSLIQYLASQGPEVGGKLGEEMLGDKGLLSSLNEKWVNVQARTKELALGLVPEFLNAGVESGIQAVDGLADQLSKETIRLQRIGTNIGKPVGKAFKAQLLKDIAAAVSEVEAIQTAARAEKVAAAAARQSAITEQAVAQALKNLVTKSDQRIGINAAPVLA